MTKKIVSHVALCAVFFAVATFFCAASVSAGERIVVVGDSITGHSENLPFGFSHEIRAALAAAGRSDVEFVPLGGSGRSVVTWQDILTESYEKDQTLDIPNIFVKKELDRAADVALVHLGMNDALKPAFVADEAGFAAWKDAYVRLIAALRERFDVKRTILTTPTMLTETPWGFKNQTMDRLALLTKEVADETGCEFYDVRAEFKDFFENARARNENLRFTLDFVHPNDLGHQALSYSFLRALGYDDVARQYRDEKMDSRLLDRSSPGMTLFVVPSDSPEKIVVKGRLFCAEPSTLRAEAPDGLRVDGIEFGDGGAFEIRLSGRTTALATPFVVRAGETTRTVALTAPYFVATGFATEPYARPEDFLRDRAVSAIDRDVLAGKNPLETVVDGKPVVWTVCRPTPDETGAANPNAVDLANLPPASAFDAAYVVRRVHSPKAQTVALKLNSEGFSTTAINTVYLNGKEVYFGCLSPRHVKAEDAISVELQEGLNVLVARVDHTYWQWAISFAFEGEGLTYCSDNP